MNATMKHIRILFIIASAIVVTACTKDYSYNDRQKKDETVGYLIGVTDSIAFNSADSFNEYIGGTLPEFDLEVSRKTIASLVNDAKLLKLIKDMYQEQGNSDFRFEKYNFTYNSKDNVGKDIELSGCVIFPNTPSGNIRHELDGVTLFHPYWLTLKNCATIAGSPVMARAVYNQAVVIPDFQGYGLTEENCHHPFLEYGILARQSIDCELAALELLENHGLVLRKDYGTYNMGMSKGAPVAMRTLEMAQNTEPESIRKKLNIKSTYCGTGPYDPMGLLEKFNSEGAGSNCWMGVMLITSAFYANPSKFQGYAIDDFFSEDFNKAKVNDGIRDNNIVDIVESRLTGETRLNELLTAFDLTSIKRILNPSFFRADGSFNYDNELFLILSEILKSNNTAEGWDPETPVLIEHSIDDDFVNYDVSMSSYENLKSLEHGGDNENVRQNTYHLLDHNTMSSLSIVRMVLMEDPAESILTKL